MTQLLKITIFIKNKDIQKVKKKLNAEHRLNNIWSILLKFNFV